MKTFVVALVAVLLLAATPAPPPTPQIPKGLGYCVSVVDQDGMILGNVQVPFHQPDISNLDEFAGSLRNAIVLVGIQTGRPDVVDAAVIIDLVDNPLPPLRPHPRTKQPDTTRKRRRPCYSSCVCATVNWNPTAAEPPSTENVQSCGGPCGGCELCQVVCPG